MCGRSQCKLHWQSNGDYFCVKVDRHTKTGKTRYCNLELFRLRDKDIPVQVIEIKGTSLFRFRHTYSLSYFFESRLTEVLTLPHSDTVTAFAWEPQGSRFTLITTNDPNAAQPMPGSLLKTSVSFYGFDARKGDFLLLSELFFSPSFLVSRLES